MGQKFLGGIVGMIIGIASLMAIPDSWGLTRYGIAIIVACCVGIFLFEIIDKRKKTKEEDTQRFIKRMEHLNRADQETRDRFKRQ